MDKLDLNQLCERLSDFMERVIVSKHPTEHFHQSKISVDKHFW